MPGAIGVLLPRTKLVHSWPSSPMPCPVRCGRPGHLVVGTEAGVGDHLARGGVDRLAGRADLGRGERGILRPLLEVPDVASGAAVGLPNTVVRVMSDW